MQPHTKIHMIIFFKFPPVVVVVVVVDGFDAMMIAVLMCFFLLLFVGDVFVTVPSPKISTHKFCPPQTDLSKQSNWISHPRTHPTNNIFVTPSSISPSLWSLHHHQSFGGAVIYVCVQCSNTGRKKFQGLLRVSNTNYSTSKLLSLSFLTQNKRTRTQSHHHHHHRQPSSLSSTTHPHVIYCPIHHSYNNNSSRS